MLPAVRLCAAHALPARGTCGGAAANVRTQLLPGAAQRRGHHAGRRNTSDNAPRNRRDISRVALARHGIRCGGALSGDDLYSDSTNMFACTSGQVCSRCVSRGQACRNNKTLAMLPSTPCRRDQPGAPRHPFACRALLWQRRRKCSCFSLPACCIPSLRKASAR